SERPMAPRAPASRKSRREIPAPLWAGATAVRLSIAKPSAAGPTGARIPKTPRRGTRRPPATHPFLSPKMPTKPRVQRIGAGPENQSPQGVRTAARRPFGWSNSGPPVTIQKQDGLFPLPADALFRRCRASRLVVRYEHITSDPQLRDFCDLIA